MSVAGREWLNGVAQDVRIAIRGFRRNPAFTMTALAMLALGIGVNAMIFTVTNAVLFKGFPQVDGNDRIVYMTSGVGCCVSYPDFQDWRAEAKSFSGMEMVRGIDKPVSNDEGLPPQLRTVTEVTSGTFRLVGRQPALGRDFTPSDEAPGAQPVAILRYEFWEREYRKDPGIIGRTIRIADVPTTVVGVMPAGFAFPQNQVLWMPLVRTPAVMNRGNRNGGWFVFGRLAEGATRGRAAVEMEAIGRNLGRLYPETNQGRNLVPHTYAFREFFIGYNATLIYQAMLGAVSFVLLIACANLANLLLARAAGRSREVSVRMALGSGRWRIVRLLLVETAMLSMLGGFLGWWVATAGLRVYSLRASGPSISDAINSTWFDNMLQYTMDTRVFIYLVAVSIGTGVLFGLAPALRLSKLDIAAALKDAMRGSTGGKRHASVANLLVIAEMALAVVLLAGAGVMIRSFLKIYMADMGVSTENVLVMRVGLPAAPYPDAAAQVSFFEQLTRRIEAHPGVESASLANVVPTWRTRRLTYEVPDGRVDTAPTDEQRRPTVSLVVTAPGYFASLRAPVTAGRDFDVFDSATGAPVVVVNERFAVTTWPGEAAVGKRIRLFGAGSEDWRTVVGVVGNVAQNDATRQTIDPVVYVPHRQVPAPGMFVVARTRVAPETLVNDWRREVAALDSNLLATPTPLSQLLADTYQYRGTTGAMFLVCAALALLLAAVGLYAVMMDSVNQRTKEIGVRMAIGATTGDISRLVFGQGLFTLGVGLALGIGASMVVNRILVTALVQVSPSDPGTYAVVCLLLTAATALGCWVPARRAMRVDPVLALQSQ